MLKFPHGHILLPQKSQIKKHKKKSLCPGGYSEKLPFPPSPSFPPPLEKKMYIAKPKPFWAEPNRVNEVEELALVCYALLGIKIAFSVCSEPARSVSCSGRI